MRHDEPDLYPVERRPPRDWFSPIAWPVARILFWLAIIGSLAIIPYASYNLGARAPTAVHPPQHSTYAEDVRDMPTLDLTGQEMTRLTVTVRGRDREALMLHIHNAITDRGGALVSGYVHDTDADGRTVLDPVTDHGSAYHVPTEYLPALDELAQPDWKRPMAYARWAQDQAAAPGPASRPPDAYVVIDTRHLLFENRRIQVITLASTAGILLAFMTAIMLSAFASNPRRVRSFEH